MESAILDLQTTIHPNPYVRIKTFMASTAMPVLLRESVELKPRSYILGYTPDDTLRGDLEVLRPGFAEQRSPDAWCVCARPIRNVHRLTRHRTHMMAYAAEGLVEVVRTVPDTAPSDAVAPLGDGRRSLIKAFVVRTPGTPRSPHPRAAWGWVSQSVPPELADAVRRVLDPVGSARWNEAPNRHGAMLVYA